MKGYEIASAPDILRHIIELRKRLLIGSAVFIVGMIVAFAFNKRILELVLIPLQAVNPDLINENLLFVTTIFEGFMTKVKLSAVSGLIITFPFHLLNILGFTFPGLSSKERRLITVSLIISSLLIVFSFYYGYFKVIPISVAFLSGAGFIPERIGMMLNYSRNVFYILQFLFATLIVFQIPVVLEILMVMKIVSRATLTQYSKHIILGTFVLSAIVTPPDFVSQLSLAIPLIGMFFITLLIAKIFHFGEC
jgi:sec-independent protein translocase protein TatC